MRTKMFTSEKRGKIFSKSKAVRKRDQNIAKRAKVE